MSDDTGMHRHDEPSAAELERVRALLAGLGEEPAPASVVERLERVLAAEPPPGPVAARRRGRWLRRGALGLAPVVAVAAVAAVLVIRSGDDTGSRRASAPPTPSTASVAEAAPSAGAAAASSVAADSALAPTAAAPAPLATDGSAAAAEAQAAKAATESHGRRADAGCRPCGGDRRVS